MHFASSTHVKEDEEDTDHQHKCCLKTGLENRARAKWHRQSDKKRRRKRHFSPGVYASAQKKKKNHLSPGVYASAFLICTCNSLLQVLEVREMKRRSAHASMREHKLSGECIFGPQGTPLRVHTKTRARKNTNTWMCARAASGVLRGIILVELSPE
jgi:hypothetical protein